MVIVIKKYLKKKKKKLTFDFAGAYIRNKVTKIVSTSTPKPLIVATSNSPGFIIP
jgi:hypothetical protein